MFDTVIMVDWSGGNDRGPREKKDAIWIGVGSTAGLEAPRYLRNRQVAEATLFERISREISVGRRIMIGFDFPFGYPDGFLSALGLNSVFDLWSFYSRELIDTPKGNNRFALADSLNARLPGDGPFWFNGSRDDLVHLSRKKPPHRHPFPERRRAEQLAKGAFTCWQMGGAGAVGSQAMTGMALLSRLRAAFPVSVWPFEPITAPVVLVEIWPSLADRAVKAALGENDIKDAVQVRVMVEALLRMQAEGTLGPALEAVPEAARKEEGWIFGLGAEQAFLQAAGPRRTR